MRSINGTQSISINTITLFAKNINSPIIFLFEHYFNVLFIIDNNKNIIGLTPFFINLIKRALCDDCSFSCSSSSSQYYYYCNEPQLNIDNYGANNNLMDIENLSVLSTEINDNNELFANNSTISGSNVLIGDEGTDTVLINQIPVTLTEENLSLGTWLLTGNIIITISSGTTWTNTNLTISFGNTVIPNGEINYRTFNTEQLTYSTTISYSYNFIFENQSIQNLNINVTGKYDISSDLNSLPTLNACSNYFLTKLN